MKQMVLFGLVLLLLFIKCKSTDEECGKYQYYDKETKLRWNCTCYNDFEFCDCINGLGGHQTQSERFYAGSSVVDKFKNSKPIGSPQRPADTSTTTDSLASTLLIRFLPADSTINKYGFDDWAKDASRRNTKISYLSMAAGCRTKFKVSIRFDIAVYDSFKISIKNDFTNNLSFDSIQYRPDIYMKAKDTVVTIYSRHIDNEGTAWIHVFGISGNDESCVAGQKLGECQDAEDQLQITVHNKGALLNLKRYEQGVKPWCWAAASAMILQWYCRSSPNDMSDKVSVDDIVKWTWGQSDYSAGGQSKTNTEGVPLANMLGSYNVTCAKMTPNSGDGSSGCKTGCGHCGTCVDSSSSYDDADPTNTCGDAKWVKTPAKEVLYVGKFGYAAPKTSFAWGVNCVLKLARNKWPAREIPEIPTTIWGPMSPNAVVQQINRCCPIIADYGAIALDGIRHSVVIVGYNFVHDVPDSDLRILYLDPQSSPWGATYYDISWQELADKTWSQSLYLVNSPSFSGDCILCR